MGGFFEFFIRDGGVAIAWECGVCICVFKSCVYVVESCV